MDHDEITSNHAAWGAAELDSIVTEYMSMLAAQSTGQPYVKAEHNRRVQMATGRSRGSVEFKFCNISAVLSDHGHTWLEGYLPRSNYQSALEQAVIRHLALAGLSAGADPLDAAGATATPLAPSGMGSQAVLRLEHLWERATGGSAVAVSPTHGGEGPWPVGPSALGADEAIDGLLEELNSGPVDHQHLIFLVGGPGNGKSALARRLTEGLELLGAPDAHLAHREYRYRTPAGRQLIVINDATIPRNSAHDVEGYLVQDIKRALDVGASLVANVNRGVLYEELAKAELPLIDPQSEQGQSRQVLKWIQQVAAGADVSGQLAAGPVQSRSWPPTNPAVSAVRTQVVLMDIYSLLEARPALVIGDDGEATLSSAYKIHRLSKRGEMDISTVPASILLSEFHAALDPALRVRPEWDPIRANVEALDADAVRRGLLILLRAAELASSRKFSYRELWGAYVRAVVGALPDRMSAEEAAASTLPEIPGMSHPAERFAVLAKLADLRLHQAIVGATSFRRGAHNVEGHTVKNPVLRLTTTVDPALDATPSWSQPVTESLAFPDEHKSPLFTLMSHPHARRLPEVVTTFDRLLDEAYVASLATVTDSARRAMDSWYGGYLLRLFAMANGRPAFLRELDEWTRAWELDVWPHSLKTALRTLLFPRRTKSSNNMMLPVLEARAHPVIGDPEFPRLVRVVESHETGFKKVRRGEALFVSIAVGDGETAELELDFDLLREALACHDGELGLSDRARATLPRLERFRANLLRPETEPAYAVVAQGQEFPLELESR